jgi:hypothetical protein
MEETKVSQYCNKLHDMASEVFEYKDADGDPKAIEALVLLDLAIKAVIGQTLRRLKKQEDESNG